MEMLRSGDSFQKKRGAKSFLSWESEGKTPQCHVFTPGNRPQIIVVNKTINEALGGGNGRVPLHSHDHGILVKNGSHIVF